MALINSKKLNNVIRLLREKLGREPSFEDLRKALNGK